MASLRRRDGYKAFTKAFTLIELLVVIAIIAILTAILLPVFATVRENSRQGVSISNLKDIQQKMEQFKLDNHRYPDVLFGYAYPGTTMKTGLATAQLYDQTYNTANPTLPQSNRAALYFPGLYPAYIKDVEEFTDPNNTVKSGDANQITIPLTASLIAPCNPTNDQLLSVAGTSGCGTAAYAAGSIVPTQRSFYIADAYDSSPQVTGANTVSGTSILRYQTAREGTACSGGKPVGCDTTVDVTTATGADLYKHQLRWQTPPAETLITCTTYHVKNADKVLVMFESGAVKKITGEDFAAGVAGQANGDTPVTNGTTNFWKLTP